MLSHLNKVQCPKCYKWVSALYGQPRMYKGHLFNDGEPCLCANCIHEIGGQIAAEGLQELIKRRKEKGR